MSALLSRLERLYAESHAQVPPAIWHDPRLTDDRPLTPASVLMAITDRATPGFLLLHRPSHMRSHPGQVAFPGGRRDPGEDAITAALREAEEELGIDPNLVTVIGSSDIYRTGSGYEITPVLAMVPADIAITPNPAEVAQWFEAPVGHVLTPENQVRKPFVSEGSTHHFIEIMWQHHRIWGVTAAIIAKLTQRLRWHG